MLMAIRKFRRRNIDSLKILGLNSSTMFPLCCCHTGYDSVALSLRFCGACNFPRCFCYDPTMTMKIWQSLVYTDGEAAANLLWHRRWCYPFVELLYPFYIKSEMQLIYVQFNVNIQRKWMDTLKSLCFSWPL